MDSRKHSAPEYTGEAAIRSALRDGSIPEGGEFVNITDDMLEKDYDNFSVILDNDEYKISSNIILKVKNENLKPFHYFRFPLIERFDEDNNNWQPVMYFALNTHRESTDNYWQTSTTGSIRFSMMLLELTENYDVELPIGTYRFAVFCGGKTFYSPEFTLVDAR